MCSTRHKGQGEVTRRRGLITESEIFWPDVAGRGRLHLRSTRSQSVMCALILTDERFRTKLFLVHCLVCGHENRDQARFCENCGARLVHPAPVAPELGPGSFTTHLAEKMRRERPSYGERRTITVLFSDAVGSTPLAEQLGEEGMYAFMRESLSRMAAAVDRYEGYVATFTGDGIMALFGAPIAHEDSARRAVAAALSMQASLDQYASVMKRTHGVECLFRVGLNTGPVVVGTVTDKLQMDFTAIGDTVNLAARMEQAADPGGILISGPTHRIVGDFFDCAALGDLSVKGKTRPVKAWRVLR